MAEKINLYTPYIVNNIDHFKAFATAGLTTASTSGKVTIQGCGDFDISKKKGGAVSVGSLPVAHKLVLSPTSFAVANVAKECSFSIKVVYVSLRPGNYMATPTHTGDLGFEETKGFSIKVRTLQNIVDELQAKLSSVEQHKNDYSVTAVKNGNNVEITANGTDYFFYLEITDYSQELVKRGYTANPVSFASGVFTDYRAGALPAGSVVFSEGRNTAKQLKEKVAFQTTNRIAPYSAALVHDLEPRGTRPYHVFTLTHQIYNENYQTFSDVVREFYVHEDVMKTAVSEPTLAGLNLYTVFADSAVTDINNIPTADLTALKTLLGHTGTQATDEVKITVGTVLLGLTLAV